MITLERTYDASLDRVWELWTTKTGIESWWGPDGFAVTVQHLDVSVGGELRYTMAAVAPEMVAYMKQANMPIATPCVIRYTAVEPRRRLAYKNVVDFVPGVTAYDVNTIVELHPAGGQVRMVLQLEPMHDPVWTGRATEGWQQELAKLEKVL